MRYYGWYSNRGRGEREKEKQAVVNLKILEHRGLWEDKTPLEGAPPDLNSEKNYEPYDDGWPHYEEPSVTIH